MFSVKPGDVVNCNGYRGVVTDWYISPSPESRGMVNVRLARGSVCVSVTDLLPFHGMETNDKVKWRGGVEDIEYGVIESFYVRGMAGTVLVKFPSGSRDVKVSDLTKV